MSVLAASKVVCPLNEVYLKVENVEAPEFVDHWPVAELYLKTSPLAGVEKSTSVSDVNAPVKPSSCC